MLFGLEYSVDDRGRVYGLQKPHAWLKRGNWFVRGLDKSGRRVTGIGPTFTSAYSSMVWLMAKRNIDLGF